VKTGRIKDLVANLLSELDISRPWVDVTLVAHHAGAEIRYADFDDNVSGMLYKEDNRVSIGVNARHFPVRRRFTIAHELGHLYLHSEQDFHVDREFKVRMRDGKSSLAVDVYEIEANTFAAELLMPTQMLLKDIQGLSIDYENDTEIRKLADTYMVSTQAMTFRLTRLGLVEPQL
jgi:Zn-dependent peptidase ImmA (M78 family)